MNEWIGTWSLWSYKPNDNISRDHIKQLPLYLEKHLGIETEINFDWCTVRSKKENKNCFDWTKDIFLVDTYKKLTFYH